MPKNIIIDGQILQTDAWYRGMGKYTMQVLQELSNNLPADTKISIIFNTKLSSDNTRFDTVAYLCPQAQQIHVPLPIPKTKNIKEKHYRTALNKIIEQRFSGAENYFLISSLIRFDYFAEFPDDCFKLILFYDLTPILFWQDLGGYYPPDLYMKRFQKLYKADHIFSISETTKNDLVKTFGLSPENITNINGGYTKIAESMKKPSHFAVPDEFILFPTGNLPHKNNEIAIKGFEQYHSNNPKSIPLLITSFFTKKDKKRLQALSKNIIFTDNVSDEELEWLFENAKSIVFASKYEGLGMPILDAVASSKPIITSRIQVFEEMSMNAFYYFKTNDYEELASSLTEALTHNKFQEKLDSYEAIMKKYTWANTRRELLSTMSELAPKESDTSIHKEHIAIVCIHPGLAKQIGRLAEPLYGYLSDKYQIDYYFDADGAYYREMERPTFLDFLDCKVYDICRLTMHSYKQYSMVLYLFDDKSLPSRAAQRACILPGIALVDSSDKQINKQQELMEKLIETNQYKVIDQKPNLTNQQLAEELIKSIHECKDSTNIAAETIKQGGSNRSIIKKLMQAQAS